MRGLESAAFQARDTDGAVEKQKAGGRKARPPGKGPENRREDKVNAVTPLPQPSDCRPLDMLASGMTGSRMAE